MNRQTMPMILMLVAGAVTCVITFIKYDSMYSRMLTLFIVLLVFYFLGCVLKWMLDFFDIQNEEKDENEEEQEEEQSEEEGEVIEKDTDVESEEEVEEENEQ